VRTGDSAVPEEEPDMRRVEPWWISLPTGNLRSSQKVSRPNEQRARLEDKEIVGWSQPCSELACDPHSCSCRG
jgi:hypothetical protein